MVHIKKGVAPKEKKRKKVQGLTCSLTFCLVIWSAICFTLVFSHLSDGNSLHSLIFGNYR